MPQPPLSVFVERSKSDSRKASPARMRFALGSSCQSVSSVVGSCALRPQANSKTVSSFAGACSCGRNPIVADFSSPIFPSSGSPSPRMRANRVDFPAQFGPTSPMRSPRFTWSDASSKRVRPPKALVTWEMVSMRAAANLANRRAGATALLISQGDHRIDPHRPERRNVAGEHGDGEEDERNSHKGKWIGRADAEKKRRHHPGENKGGAKPDEQAEADQLEP